MIHIYLVCVIIGLVLGWIVGWTVRGDENRRYHTRRSMAGMALDPLPPARQTVVGWIPRGCEKQHLDTRADVPGIAGRRG